MIFEINATYEISLNDISYLPARSLDGLIVYRLTVDDPNLLEIDKDVFEGVLRLRRFHIRHSKIKQIPDFRVIRHSIRNINIDSSGLTSLDGPSLQNLSLLETLSLVNNSIRSVDADAFKGTEGIIILDLSNNLLTSLPPHLLDQFTQLRKLALSYNQLLHVDQLFAVTQPRFIYLDFNNLTDVDSILYPNMTNVETVILASNPIANISEKSFIGKVPQVRFIYLDHCLLRDFDVRHFQNLDNLAILDLSYNLIEEIKNQSIKFGKNLEIDLIGNQIRRFDAEITFSIKRIYLNENKLQSLGRTLQYSQMTEVSVARNLLQYLSVEDFKGVHGTTNLELQGNRIQWIDRDTFKEIRNDLHYLDLSSNKITALNGSIRFLSQLKSLNMTVNLLETFDRGEFTGLNELSELYLQHNRIKDLTGQLQLLPQLQYIMITHNNINVIRPEQIPKSLRYIYLANNPLKCNCRLLPFLLWLNTSNSPETDMQLCPPSTSNKDRTLSTTCPDMCSCSCAEEGIDYFISVDCSSKNLTDVPRFLTSDFLEIQDTSPITYDFRRSLIFDQNTNPYFHLRDRVLGINLENNSIESFDTAQPPPDLLHLYLSKNKLRMLPESMLYNLKHLRRVSLSGNPWDCDCQAIGFKQWLLSRMDIVKDVNITKCGINEHDSSVLDGKVIWTLTDLDLCPADIGMYVMVAFGILSFIMLCLAAKILYTRYELHIKVYLYSRGFTWVKQKDLDHDKAFDAFISFSHKDEDFVSKEIISMIEGKDPNIRLCIHYKHFRAGEYIQDNIINAVQSSKRTVLILSRNFLESEWCLMEFRAAHIQALEDKVHRIIVIKVGDIDPEQIDPAIKVYLDSTTYLTWGEKYFWNNLMYVLPTSGTPRSAEPQENGLMKLKQIAMDQFNANV